MGRFQDRIDELEAENARLRQRSYDACHSAELTRIKDEVQRVRQINRELVDANAKLCDENMRLAGERDGRIEHLNDALQRSNQEISRLRARLFRQAQGIVKESVLYGEPDERPVVINPSMGLAPANDGNMVIGPDVPKFRQIIRETVECTLTQFFDDFEPA